MGRAAAVNILNINNGKNTVEFRVANGSINPEVWIENAKLYGRIIQMSEILAQIEKKVDRTPEEQRLLDLKEMLKDKELPENEKLEILMDLLFTDEKDKDIFRQRYEANLKAIQEKEQEPDGTNPLACMEFADVVDFRHSTGEFEDIAREKRIGKVNEITGETRNGVEEIKGIEGKYTRE